MPAADVPASSPSRHDDPHTSRRTILLAVGVAVVILLVVRLVVLDTVVVTSDSMRPALEPGDRLLVLRTAAVERGDVVVLDGSRLLAPGGGSGSRTGGALGRALGIDGSSAYVKRVVGVPGDRVACCDGQGRLTVDGRPLEEPYVTGPTDQVTFDVTVPEDRYWVLGDNRGDSADSRSALGRPGGGMLRADEVVGEVVWRYWPRQRWGDPTAVTVTSAPLHAAGRSGARVVSRMGDTAVRSPATDRRTGSTTALLTRPTLLAHPALLTRPKEPPP